MIWLTWRQFRTQLLVTAAALAVATVYLVVVGLQLHSGFRDLPADCAGACPEVNRLIGHYRNPYFVGGALVLLAPALIGAFWGAPLIARELEAGTHRMVWNQSVGRGRWLAVKLLVTCAAAMATAGLLSLLVTWFVGPMDRLNQDRFHPLLFDVRGLVPLGYAAFAVALGVCAGLFLRRTVAAMAVTLAVFTAVQVLMPQFVRPHLQPAIHTQVPLNTTSLGTAGMFGFSGGVGDGDSPMVASLDIPNGWVLTGVEPQPVLDASGRALTLHTQPCPSAANAPAERDCLAKADLHIAVDYQPADRYWPFQWIETAIYLALAAALAALTSWGLRRRLG
ncbi:ABC transporter permease subunit [Kitasatospora sp. NPDC092948]|uniref:ABC transporter permease subunit n=1 Tax=Kitasatospora sp. NPDC092948 TaxID=3364088 RepID=UPI0038036D9E